MTFIPNVGLYSHQSLKDMVFAIPKPIYALLLIVIQVACCLAPPGKSGSWLQESCDGLYLQKSDNSGEYPVHT